MSTRRHALPQLAPRLFLTDGGIGTTLIFREGVEIPHFATFTLLGQPGGRALLERLFAEYAELAVASAAGIIMDSVTWRASADWGRLLGYSDAALAQANREAIELLAGIRARYEIPVTPVVISACMGPRRAAYSRSAQMSVDEAFAYHITQVETLAATEADLISAMTMNYPEEAIGIVEAARHAGMPVAVSFTVETDGRLVSGMTLREALENIDAATAHYPAYYMVNCAHTSHFADSLQPDGAWLQRLRGLRSNASAKSHAELDESPQLDRGDPAALGRDYASLLARLPHVNIVGGCCGTDAAHARCIAEACRPRFS
jgi:S-methylmethionine-dependent homocysteine/selenocysteine methylase